VHVEEQLRGQGEEEVKEEEEEEGNSRRLLLSFKGCKFGGAPFFSQFAQTVLYSSWIAIPR
jgi:hypothetical protein